MGVEIIFYPEVKHEVLERMYIASDASPRVSYSGCSYFTLKLSTKY